MFDFFKKRRILTYSNGAQTYIQNNFEHDRPRFSRELDLDAPRKNVKYSDRVPSSNPTDTFDAKQVSKLINAYRITSDANEVLNYFVGHTNRTFVDEVIRYIRERNVKDSTIYKAADVDRRLFSKMMSDRNYKPSKDTAISIAFALCLSLDEAKDLLERAGYSLSHSNKRDIIIEYFFVEQVHKITDINEVLYGLGEKTLGK